MCVFVRECVCVRVGIYSVWHSRATEMIYELCDVISVTVESIDEHTHPPPHTHTHTHTLSPGQGAVLALGQGEGLPLLLPLPLHLDLHGDRVAPGLAVGPRTPVTPLAPQDRTSGARTASADLGTEETGG